MEGQSDVVWFWFHNNLERPKGNCALEPRRSRIERPKAIERCEAALNRDVVALNRYEAAFKREQRQRNTVS
jgi:hypothetical protein